MCAYKDTSGMFTTAAVEIEDEADVVEQLNTSKTSLDKVFNMENRYIDSFLHTCSDHYSRKIQMISGSVGGRSRSQ